MHNFYIIRLPVFFWSKNRAIEKLYVKFDQKKYIFIQVLITKSSNIQANSSHEIRVRINVPSIEHFPIFRIRFVWRENSAHSRKSPAESNSVSIHFAMQTFPFFIRTHIKSILYNTHKKNSKRSAHDMCLGNNNTASWKKSCRQVLEST